MCGGMSGGGIGASKEATAGVEVCKRITVERNARPGCMPQGEHGETSRYPANDSRYMAAGQGRAHASIMQGRDDATGEARGGAAREHVRPPPSPAAPDAGW